MKLRKCFRFGTKNSRRFEHFTEKGEDRVTSPVSVFDREDYD